ncbi:MAG: TonB-dependent receptor [Candidatus Omnitrophota bacterium]
MRKKISRYLLIVIGLGMLCFLPQQAAAQVEEYVSPETLLFEEIPMVYSSAKREQLLSETASTVEVINANEIKLTGALYIAEALMQLPGLRVRTQYEGARYVGIRGLPDTKHVLVTLDGNNIFVYHANIIYWESIPIALPEIDRIEIIKGPGGIFYGGNAFSGVINIFSKKPRDIKGTQVDLTFGEYETLHYSVMHGGSYGKVDYKLSLGAREINRWSDKKLEDTNSDFYGGSITYNIDEETLTSLTYRNGDTDRCSGGMCDPGESYFALRYEKPDFWGRFFWFRHKKPCTIAPATAIFYDNNYELELMRTLRLGDDNILSVGGYAKRTQLETKIGNNNDNQKNQVQDWAINAENEYRGIENFIFSLGGRYEYHSELEGLALGRGSIIYTPVGNHSLRFNIATGYYIPSLLEFFGAPTYPGLYKPNGNRSLTEEKITSYELSYYGKLTDKIKINTNLFYNEYKDLEKQWLQSLSPLTLSYANAFDAEQVGVEIGVDLLITDWLTGFANYGYNEMDRTDHGTLEIDPQNTFNIGLRAASEIGINASIIGHYVSESYEFTADYFGLDAFPAVIQALFAPTNVPVDSYFILNARIAYMPHEDWEFALNIFNLFDQNYTEHYMGYGADEVGRRVTASATAKF